MSSKVSLFINRLCKTTSIVVMAVSLAMASTDIFANTENPVDEQPLSPLEADTLFDLVDTDQSGVLSKKELASFDRKSRTLLEQLLIGSWIERFDYIGSLVDDSVETGISKDDNTHFLWYEPHVDKLVKDGLKPLLKFVRTDAFPKGIDSIDKKYIYQGIVGNCGFISIVLSMIRTQKGKEAIYNMITANDDGSYDVTAATGEVINVVPDIQSLYHTGIYSTKNPEEAGIWFYILQKAAMKWMNTRYPEFNSDDIRLVLHATPLEAAMSFLINKKGEIHTVNSIWTTRSKVISLLKEAHESERVMSVVFKDNIDKVAKYQKIYAQHGYGFLDYNAETEQVTVRNPHGSNEPVDPVSQLPLDGEDDGEFVLPVDEFIAMTEYMFIETNHTLSGNQFNRNVQARRNDINQKQQELDIDAKYAEIQAQYEETKLTNHSLAVANKRKHMDYLLEVVDKYDQDITNLSDEIRKIQDNTYKEKREFTTKKRAYETELRNNKRSHSREISDIKHQIKMEEFHAEHLRWRTEMDWKRIVGDKSEWVVRYHKVNELRELERKEEKAKDNLKALQQRTEEAKKQIEGAQALEKEVKQKEVKAQKAVETLERLEEQLSKKEETLKTRENLALKKNEALNAQMEQLNKTEALLNTQTEQLNKSEAALKAREEQLRKVQETLKKQEKQMRKSEETLKTREEKIRKDEIVLKVKAEQASKEASSLKAREEQLHKDKQTFNARIEKLHKDEATVKAQQDLLRKSEEQVNAQNEQLRKNAVAIKAQQDQLRKNAAKLKKPEPSLGSVASDIFSLLSDAGAAAKDMGTNAYNTAKPILHDAAKFAADMTKKFNESRAAETNTRKTPKNMDPMAGQGGMHMGPSDNAPVGKGFGLGPEG